MAKIYNLDELGVTFINDNGWIATVSEFAKQSGHAIENIHLGTITPGRVRGNHVHNIQTEWDVVLGGKAIVAWKEGEENIQKEIGENDHIVFEFEPGCPHAVKNIDNKDIYICAFVDQKHNDKNPDKILVSILS